MQEAVVSREEYNKLMSDYQYVCFQLAELQRVLFGTKSERFHSLKEDPLQLELFACGAGEETGMETTPEGTPTVSCKRDRVKKRSVRSDFPEHLHREEEIFPREPSG